MSAGWQASRALAVASCMETLAALASDLDERGYGDALDEIDAATDHLSVAVKILNAPDEGAAPGEENE